MLANPPTDRAMITTSVPSRASPMSVVVRTESPMPPDLGDMLGRPPPSGAASPGSTSMRVTAVSWSASVLAKSTRSRGVQWVLPPPMMVIRGVLIPRTVAATGSVGPPRSLASRRTQAARATPVDRSAQDIVRDRRWLTGSAPRGVPFNESAGVRVHGNRREGPHGNQPPGSYARIY